MARSFPTSTDHIQIPFTTPVGHAFSWSGWLNPNGSAAIARDASGSGSNGIYNNSGTYAVFANGAFANSTFTITNSVWTQFGFSCTTGTNGISFFVNGAAAGTAASNQISSGATNWWIGNDVANRPAGTQQDFAFWNAILSPVEWAALSAGMRPGQIRPQSLIGWWPLDGYNHPALDRSGFANNGVLSGTALAVGPPKISAAPIFVTQNIKRASTSAVLFRKTLSQIGGRIGSRQASVGWFN